MKRHFIALVFSLLSTVTTAYAQTSDDPGANIHYVNSAIVNEQYELRVSFPANYYQDTNADFPVVYVLDGQWDFGVAADIYGKLIYDGMIPPLIVVAITWAGENVDYSLKRQRDFLLSENAQIPESGGAFNFLAALQQEIIPFTEMSFRANGQRVLMGSSFGGLFATYAMLEEPGLFDGYVALAAPYGVEQAYFNERITELAGTSALKDTRLYLGVGSYDPNSTQVAELAAQLRGAKLKGLYVDNHLLRGLGHAGATPVGYTHGYQFVFQRPKLKFPGHVLQQYSGSYEIAPGFPTIEISVKNFKLQFTQQGQTIDFYAESENQFYALGVDLQLEFLAGDNGAMTMLVTQSGNTYPFTRL